LPDARDEIEGSELLGDAVVHHFDWAVSCDPEGYLRLLDTSVL
jgi:hypothetical protein